MKQRILVAVMVAVGLAMTATTADAFWISCDTIFGFSWC